MAKWIVEFSENGEEYIGFLTVTAEVLECDPENEKAFVADGVRVEIDEYIIGVKKLPTPSAEPR